MLLESPKICTNPAERGRRKKHKTSLKTAPGNSWQNPLSVRVTEFKKWLKSEAHDEGMSLQRSRTWLGGCRAREKPKVPHDVVSGKEWTEEDLCEQIQQQERSTAKPGRIC